MNYINNVYNIDRNILPKGLFLTLFFLYIVFRYIMISYSKNNTQIDFTLKGVDYDMPYEIYYDEKNDFQYKSANIIDYDPKTDIFTIKLIDTDDTDDTYNKELKVTRDKIKTLSGEKYIYYPNQINYISSELIGFYSSIIAFLLCYIFISFSIFNEKIFSKILNNNINLTSVFSTLIHDYSHMFLQIVLLMILICFIFFYKDKLNNFSLIMDDWHNINITLAILNIYLFFIYPTYSFKHENEVFFNKKFSQNLSNITTSHTIKGLLLCQFLLSFIYFIIQKLYGSNVLGYYPYGAAFIIVGLIFNKIYNDNVDKLLTLLSVIFLVYNVYNSNNLEYNILFTLIGFNLINIVTYFLNYNKYNYRHSLSIILSGLLIFLIKNTYDNLVYKITNG